MKKVKGFTLIELIVVIAIIGVLAAILVPAMMGWVRKASINSANANAKTVFTNAQTAAQEMETNGSIISGTYSYNTSGAFVSAVKSNLSGGNNKEWSVSVDNNVVTAAAAINSTWAGGYPNPCPNTQTKKYNLSQALTNAADGGSWN